MTFSLPSTSCLRQLPFEVLPTTRARSSKYFILCLSVKTIRAKQVNLYYAYSVQRGHATLKTLEPKAKFYFIVTFSLQQPSKLLKLPIYSSSRVYATKTVTPTWKSQICLCLISKNELLSEHTFFVAMSFFAALCEPTT